MPTQRADGFRGFRHISKECSVSWGEDHHNAKAMKESSLQLCLISVICGCSQIASDRKTTVADRSQAETICGVVELLCLFIPSSPEASGNHQTKRNTGAVIPSWLNLVVNVLASR